MAFRELRQRMFCMLGYHKRNHRRVREDGSLLVASCLGCGRRMVKYQRGWAADLRVPPPPR